MLYLSNCLIRCVCKKSLLSFSYFSMVIKKNIQNQNKFVGNLLSLAPPPPSATVYVLQYSSFWNRKAKSYGIKTTSYARKTTSYAHKTTSYAHKNYKLRSQNYKLRAQNYKLRSQNYKLHPQNYKLRVQNLQV